MLNNSTHLPGEKAKIVKSNLRCDYATFCHLPLPIPANNSTPCAADEDLPQGACQQDSTSPKTSSVSDDTAWQCSSSDIYAFAAASAPCCVACSASMSVWGGPALGLWGSAASSSEMSSLPSSSSSCSALAASPRRSSNASSSSACHHSCGYVRECQLLITMSRQVHI